MTTLLEANDNVVSLDGFRARKAQRKSAVNGRSVGIGGLTAIAA